MRLVRDRGGAPGDEAGEPTLSMAQARALALEVLGSERGREVAAALRPRAFVPFLRSGLPVAHQLRLASLERRLVRHQGALAVVTAPGDRRTAVPRGASARRLAALDRWWEVVVLSVPPFVTLVLAAILAAWRDAPARLTVVLLLVLATLAWLTLTMTVSVFWLTAGAVRAVEVEPERAEPSEGMLLGRYWSVSLVHAPDAGAVPGLVDAARSRADTLATAISGDRRPTPPPLLLSLEGVTTLAAERVLTALPGAYPARRRTPRLVRVGTGSPQEHDVPNPNPRGITLLVVAVLVALLSCAPIIADRERAFCRSNGCDPGVGLRSTPLALEWLVDQLFLGGDSPGLVAARFDTRILGWLFSALGILLVISLVVAAGRQIAARKGAVERFEKAADAGTFADVTPTMAVVTAIPVEMAAVQSLLPDGRTHWVAYDNANYYLARVLANGGDAELDVVVTLVGEGGNDAAAGAVANLSRSFPSVNSVIMCGIAAGAPRPAEPQRHVRLGDVVVAWEIVDFDHVDERESGPARRNGMPQPSSALKRVDEMLTTAEHRGERPWERWLDPRVTPAAARFPRPGRGSDVLRDATGRQLQHPRSSLTGHRPGLPKVHHGAIGSSDRSLRNAALRDELAREHDLIAFEMEGKGFGGGAERSDLSWMVVRGISDYGGADGSDPRWRQYAAFAAAAYVRELVACAPGRSPRGSHVRGT